MFDFDKFINEVCIGSHDNQGKVKEGFFGRKMRYIPANQAIKCFLIAGDFHRTYRDVQTDIMQETAITSEQLTVFIRKADMPRCYPTPLQGDTIEMDGFRFQIVDVQTHIPGSLQLVLHEEA